MTHEIVTRYGVQTVSPKPENKYKIVFQWRNPAGCVGDPNDWRSWRIFATWPVAFPSREAAEACMAACKDIFANLRHHRKVSVSAVPITHRPCGRAKGKYDAPKASNRIR